MASVTIALDDALLAQVEALAKRLDRPRHELVSEALGEWLAHQQQQIAKIEAGLAAAERGEFASEERVRSVFARHGVDW